MEEKLLNNGMKMLIDKLTRKEATLDHIYTNNIEKIETINISSDTTSDHSIIEVIRKMKMNKIEETWEATPALPTRRDREKRKRQLSWAPVSKKAKETEHPATTIQQAAPPTAQRTKGTGQPANIQQADLDVPPSHRTTARTQDTNPPPDPRHTPPSQQEDTPAPANLAKEGTLDTQDTPEDTGPKEQALDTIPAPDNHQEGTPVPASLAKEGILDTHETPVDTGPKEEALDTIPAPNNLQEGAPAPASLDTKEEALDTIPAPDSHQEGTPAPASLATEGTLDTNDDLGHKEGRRDALKEMMRRSNKMIHSTKHRKGTKGHPTIRKKLKVEPREGAITAKSLFICNMLPGKGKVNQPPAPLSTIQDSLSPLNVIP